MDNILSADLAQEQLRSKCNNQILFLSCVLDVFSKCAWVVSLKDRKDITVTNVFKKFLLIWVLNPTKYD